MSPINPQFNPDGKLPVGTLRRRYTSITFTPISGSITNFTSENLPDGFTFTFSGGDGNPLVLSGTPTELGTFTFTITGLDGATEFSQEYTLTIKRAHKKNRGAPAILPLPCGGGGCQPWVNVRGTNYQLFASNETTGFYLPR